MDIISGKTFRRLDIGRRKDTSIFVQTEKPIQNTTDILGYEFHQGLSYSMKKKQRWQLSSVLSNASYDGDVPVCYTKYQCIYDDTPLLGLYLYDSLSNKTLGSSEVSNRRLEKGRFNIKSVFHEIEKNTSFKNEEKKSYKQLRREKSKMNMTKLFTDDANFEICDQPLPTKELDLSKGRVFITEYIHVTDLSKVNKVKPSRYTYGRYSNIRKRCSIEQLSDYDDEDDNDESESDLLYTDEIKRPFIISNKDFLCQNNGHSRKQKRQKNKNFYSKSVLDKYNSVDIVEEIIDLNTKSEVYDDILPMVAIDVSREQFIDQLKLIVSFCKCWKCSVSPLTILIDLDEIEETRQKSFVLLKPIVQKIENIISIKVLFNISNDGFNMNDVLDEKFDDLLAIVTFVQSKLQSGTGEKLKILQKLVSMNESRAELLNLPKAKSLESAGYLYCYHDEWKDCELSIDNLGAIIDFNENLNYSMDVCCVCESVIPDDEIVLMSHCEHRVCVHCLSHDIAQRLHTNANDMVCPYDSCNIRLDAPTILSLVNWRHYRLRLDILESSVLGRCGQPCSDCGSVLMDTGRDRVTEYVCTCGKIICHSCGQLQHWPSSCLEMKKHNENITKLKLNEVQRKVVSSKKLKTVGRRSYNSRKLGTFWRPYNKQPTADDLTDENILTFPNMSTVVPFQGTKSPTLKFYNQGVYLRILLRKENMCMFEQSVSGISSMVVGSCTRSLSSDDLTMFYGQVLRMLESMYVSAYHIHRRDNPDKLEQLKTVTGHLIFYVTRIQMLTEEMDELVRQQGYHRRSGTVMEDKYWKLESYVQDALLYARKTVVLFKF